MIKLVERFFLRDMFFNEVAAFLIEEVRDFRLTSDRATEIARQLTDTFPREIPDGIFSKLLRDSKYLIPEIAKIQQNFINNYLNK